MADVEAGCACDDATDWAEFESGFDAAAAAALWPRNEFISWFD